MDRLLFLPEKNSYSFNDPTQTKTRQLDGPMGFYAKDIPGKSFIVTCRWLLTLDEYLDFFEFYKQKSENLENFLIGLFIDNSDLIDYKAVFIQKSFQISEQNGDTISISINLEVLKA